MRTAGRRDLLVFNRQGKEYEAIERVLWLVQIAPVFFLRGSDRRCQVYGSTKSNRARVAPQTHRDLSPPLRLFCFSIMVLLSEKTWQKIEAFFQKAEIFYHKT
ncbi:hypothetical protein U27_01508 [Candidatus Vecturithrix granuli]|uniref:Uncharacterized protein n=1 Tax=Vecturithrix granuli TaxID=1499967 RepID=A0A081CAK2_VECG1|nr:hypothetical protein U27_01508 [Candidatus Vecturithrix granuli]